VKPNAAGARGGSADPRREARTTDRAGKAYFLSGPLPTMEWTRHRKRWVILLGAIAVGAVLTGLLLWVPVAQEQSGYTVVGFQLYAFEAVNIESSPWANFSYRGVEFELPAVDCPQNTGGGNVCGRVVEPSGANYSFVISFPPACSGFGSWATWVSPGQHEAVEIEDCSRSTHLLVAV
jgi:hypothetical protein